MNSRNFSELTKVDFPAGNAMNNRFSRGHAHAPTRARRIILVHRSSGEYERQSICRHACACSTPRTRLELSSVLRRHSNRTSPWSPSCLPSCLDAFFGRDCFGQDVLEVCSLRSTYDLHHRTAEFTVGSVTRQCVVLHLTRVVDYAYPKRDAATTNAMRSDVGLMFYYRSVARHRQLSIFPGRSPCGRLLHPARG